VCLYGQQTTPRLRQGGMEFAVWVFKHASPQQLAPAGASILDTCLQLLDDCELHARMAANCVGLQLKLQLSNCVDGSA
jgi:hypothetical protein